MQNKENRQLNAGVVLQVMNFFSTKSHLFPFHPKDSIHRPSIHVTSSSELHLRYFQLTKKTFLS